MFNVINQELARMEEVEMLKESEENILDISEDEFFANLSESSEDFSDEEIDALCEGSEEDCEDEDEESDEYEDDDLFTADY